MSSTISIAKIRAAYSSLRRSGEKVTTQALALRLGKTEISVRSYIEGSIALSDIVLDREVSDTIVLPVLIRRMQDTTALWWLIERLALPRSERVPQFDLH